MATPPSSSVSIAESVPALSEPQRLLNTFIAPSKTFTDLKRKPSWWAPWLLAAIFAVVFAYTVQRQVGFEQVAEKMANASPRSAQQMERMEPAQREQQIQAMARFWKFFFYGLPLVILLYGLIIATALMLTFNLVMGAGIPFKKSLAVVFYSFVPQTVLYNLIVIAPMMAPGFVSESFDFENPAATNSGAFLDRSAVPRPLYTLAVGVDVFNIWTVILLGIGFSCVSKVKRSTATWTVVIWLVIVKLLQALGAAFS